MIGQRIDRYVIRGVLGRGASGAVFRAHDPQLGREVALKVLHRTDARAQARFEREQRACARLEHPNLVRVHDVGVSNGLPFIAMELVGGQSLAERVDEGGPHPPQEAARIMRDAARAIAHAHAEGVLHRDIKPANLILTPEGEARVVDFGLVSLKESDSGVALTRTGVLLGTPSFMSPEQAAGLRAAEQSDVYGLGATLFHLLTGRPPFVEAPLLEVHRRDAPAPSEFSPAVPPELDAICRDALARSASDRTPSATAFADALEAFLEDEFAPDLVPERPRRHWLPAFLSGALVVALALTCAVLVSRSSTEPTPKASTTATGEPIALPDPAPRVDALLAEARARARDYGSTEAVAAIYHRAEALLDAGTPRRDEIALERARLTTRRLQYALTLEALAPYLDRAGPHQAQARCLLTLTLLQQDRPDAAQAVLQRAPLSGPWGSTLQALRARNRHQPNQVIAFAREALRQDPTLHLAQLLIAITLYEQRKPEARAALDELANGPARDDVHLWLTRAALAQTGGAGDAPALAAKAHALCSPVLAPLVVLIRTRIELDRGDPRSAIRVLADAPQRGRPAAPYLLLRGLAHDALLQPSDARFHWRRALALDPALPTTPLFRAIQPSARRARVRRALGLPHEGGKLTSSERQSVERILSTVPDELRASLKQVLTLAILGHPITKLQPSFSRLRRLAPNARARFWVAVILGGRGFHTLARKLLSQSLALSWSPETALRLALVHLQLGDRKEALAGLEGLVARSPNSAPGACARATLLLQRSGAPATALALVDRALQLDASHAPSVLLRALILRELKRPAEALQQLEAAVQASARYLDLYPMTLLVQARAHAAIKSRDRGALHQTLLKAERTLQANASPGLRVTLAELGLQFPVKSHWEASTWDWLWEAEHSKLVTPVTLRRVHQVQGVFLLRRAHHVKNRGPLLVVPTRGQVEERWRLAQSGGGQISAQNRRDFATVFGSAYRRK